MPKILVVEDNVDLANGLEVNLKKEGYKVLKAVTGEDALKLALRDCPDLILLDIMLPGISGFDVCRELRNKSIETPIIMLTAKSDELDRVVGLELGADDYVVKPFSPRELVARVKAVLRRQEAVLGKAEVIEVSELRLDSRTREVTVRGRSIQLSALEFKLLHFLASQPRRVFTREQLLDNVWGRDRFVTPRTVDVHIRRLREKIERQEGSPQYVQTVRGSGYRFSPGHAGSQED